MGLFEFLFFFLPVVVWIFDRISPRWRPAWLLLASLVFYAGVSPRHLPFLVASIAFNYVVGRELAVRGGRRLLALSVTANLLVLAGWGAVRSIPVAPGLSYITFAQVAFLVDAFAGRTRADDPVRYALFVSFFPAVLAGPISRHGQLAPQPGQDVDAARNARGVGRVVCGIAMKLLADSLAPLGDRVFEGTALLTCDEMVTGLIAYAFQVYFDFAGYSSIAIGLGEMLGVSLPENFERPYLATSIAEFWRRWHITLSEWLRDYVFLPLTLVAGTVSWLRPHLHLTGVLASLATMALCGLWHGRELHFLIWGLGHGVLIAAHRSWRITLSAFSSAKRRRALDESRAFGCASWFLTFVCVVALWVPFRARDMEVVRRIGLALSTPGDLVLDLDKVLLALGVLFVVAPVVEVRVALTQTRDYLFGWRARAAPYSLFSHAVLVGLMAAFYTTRLDRELVRRLPIITETAGCADQVDDFRSNMIVNELYQGDERKIVICGSSFAKRIGSYRFQVGNTRYKSGTVAMSGGHIADGLRGALAVLGMPELDTVILGITPLNCAPMRRQLWFHNQGMAGFELLGFPLPGNPLSEVHPVSLDPWTLARLTFAYRGAEFYQIHFFLNKLLRTSSTLIAPPPKELDVTPAEQDRFRFQMRSEIGYAQIKCDPVWDPKNGSEDTFHWKERGCLESIRPGGDVYRALTQLNRLLAAHRVRLVLYNTPTADPARAPHIYPPGFLPEFNACLARLVADARIEYHDLSAVFPYCNTWMNDFIHPTDKCLDYLHRYLIYALTPSKK